MIQRSRYADGLAALSDGTLVSGRIAAWAAEHGLPTFGWEREYGRFHPGQSPWAVLAYAHPHGLAIRVDVATTPRDWEQISVVPAAADPGLPGLAAVLARLSNPRIVRYRPGHRCTVHGQTPQGPIFVKGRTRWSAGPRRRRAAVANPRRTALCDRRAARLG